MPGTPPYGHRSPPELPVLGTGGRGNPGLIPRPDLARVDFISGGQPGRLLLAVLVLCVYAVYPGSVVVEHGGPLGSRVALGQPLEGVVQHMMGE